MRKLTSTQIILFILTLFTFIAGYAYLRYAYHVADSFPFSQEIVLIVLGTVATVLITALLLNQQTAVEIKKEQNLKFIELKALAYEQLLGLIEEMSVAESITNRDLTRLQFVTHRLAIFASPPVLDEYSEFLDVVRVSAKDGTFFGDSEELSQALGKLTVQIRLDLLGEKDALEQYTPKRISRLIAENADDSAEIRIE